MDEKQMAIEVKYLIDAMQEVLNSCKAPDVYTLKLLLNKKKAREYLECLHLYHAWSIAELCCASPDWEPCVLGAICTPDSSNPLYHGLLCDIFSELAKVKIPPIADTPLEPAVDIRLRVLCTLKKIELAQALKLEISLYTMTGERLAGVPPLSL